MAGFRIGRGRDNRTPQQHSQQAPYGSAAAPPPYAQQQHQHQWQQAQQAQQPYGEPEYFGDPHEPHAPHRHPHPHPHPPHDPYAADSPGHTRAFSINDDAAYGEGATYQAGAAPAPAGPRLPWKQLLSGIVLRPGPTFWQMRDHAVWGPALIVTFLYGLLALFGFDQAREEAINATISTAIPYVLVTGVMFVVGGLILGAVTHTLARQLGGDGGWQPTIGLSMLIMSMTDAPRLVFALFLGGENTLVQIIGWLSWLAAGALFTSMVRTSHDLPWPKALGASAIQLVALLSLIKLGTI
ncbi:Yip1 family protein [Streptomyces ficellus]|uniref:Yip1 family protein n=1 Tax=Streptomyces ficellus TaxID=1977088 RepID=A0ABT7Z4H9_9ACTN|nr:Yip1 family protein [Streptomyces ficellus]MDN3294377.1 Yip1 family protein [Streptomyces ficellus]